MESRGREMMWKLMAHKVIQLADKPVLVAR
jgi:hypothetical protein